MTLSIIIPAHKEVRTIREVLAGLAAVKAPTRKEGQKIRHKDFFIALWLRSGPCADIAGGEAPRPKITPGIPPADD